MKSVLPFRKHFPVVIFCLAGWLFALAKSASLRQTAPTEGGSPVSSGSTPAPASAPPFRSVASAGVPTPSVHSATAVELEDGTIRAYWFGGTKEGLSDVAIWTADLVEESWTGARVAVDRRSIALGTRRYIKNLGNPVAHLDANNDLNLFVVSVSLGGWSGSAINRIVFEPDGERIREVNRLVASPILNLGTLVRGPAFDNADGGFYLPAYQELAKLFPLMLRLDRNGRVLSRESLAIRGNILQPWMLRGDRDHGDGIFFRRGRNTEAKVFHSHGREGSWSSPAPIPVANPDSAVAAVRLSDGTLILAANPDPVFRSKLILLRAADPTLAWEEAYTVESGDREEDEKDFHYLEYSYPWLMMDSRGFVHLFYTWNRKEIRHLRLSQEQLRGKGGYQ